MRRTSNRANLHSNGTLTMSGVYGNGYLGYSNDHSTAQVNLHTVFKGRSIVKVVVADIKQETVILISLL